MAVPGPESCLPFISCFDSKPVIGILKVDFAKVLSTRNPVYDFYNQG
jgi:hypothetical protein